MSKEPKKEEPVTVTVTPSIPPPVKMANAILMALVPLFSLIGGVCLLIFGKDDTARATGYLLIGIGGGSAPGAVRSAR